MSCFDGCGTVAPRSSTGSSGQAAILLLCGSVNSSSYSPAGCCCVVGGTPAQSPGESPAARGLSATACGAIFHTGCLTLFRSGCWMAGCGYVLLCSSYSPIGLCNLSQGRLGSISACSPPQEKCSPKAASVRPCVTKFWPEMSSNGLRWTQNDPVEQQDCSIPGPPGS